MKSSTFLVRFLFSMAVLGQTGGTSLGASADGIHYAFEIQKENYVMGEPIWAMITVSNGAPNEIMFKLQHDADNSYVFSSDNKKGVEVLSPYLSFGGFYEKHLLQPGEVYTGKIFLSDYMRFTVPGPYTVICTPTFPVETKEGPVRIEGVYSDKIYVSQDDEKLQQIVDQYAESLRGDDVVSRAGAVKLLAAMRNSMTLNLLKEALADNSEEIVYLALDGISWINNKDAQSIMEEYVLGHGQTRTGLYAERLLSGAKAPAATGLSGADE